MATLETALVSFIPTEISSCGIGLYTEELGVYFYHRLHTETSVYVMINGFQ
jgi:hypothetical protein